MNPDLPGESPGSEPVVVPVPDPPLTILGRAAVAAERAASTAAILVEELRLERLWRGWAKKAGAVVLLLLLGFGALIAVTLIRFDAILQRVDTNPAACARQPAAHQTLGCENHVALVALEKATSPQATAAADANTQRAIAAIVNQTDCRVRVDLADVLHVAIPNVAFTLPATSACPAYTPNP